MIIPRKRPTFIPMSQSHDTHIKTTDQNDVDDWFVNEYLTTRNILSGPKLMDWSTNVNEFEACPSVVQLPHLDSTQRQEITQFWYITYITKLK